MECIQHSIALVALVVFPPHATAEECICARRRVRLVPCPSTHPPRLKVTPPHPDPRLDTPCAKSPAGVKQGHPKDRIALCVAVGMILCLFVFIDGLLFCCFLNHKSDLVSPGPGTVWAVRNVPASLPGLDFAPQERASAAQQLECGTEPARRLDSNCERLSGQENSPGHCQGFS